MACRGGDGHGRCTCTARSAIAKLEATDELAQLIGFVGQGTAGGCGLFHHGGVLLRGLVHLVYGGVDL